VDYATGGKISSSSPSVANGVVYFGSNDNNVNALNADTGGKLWELHHWLLCADILAHGREWDGLYRIGRWHVYAFGLLVG
jgi:hypothetical protein